MCIRDRGVFVRDLDAEADEEYAHEVDGILDDCVMACRELGLSLDDIQKCMDHKIKQIKRSEGADAAAAPGGGAARIVEVDMGARTRAARTGV